MNQLLPIIRRVRRPLLTVDVPPPVVGNVEPVQVDAERETRNAEQESPALSRDAATQIESDAQASS